MALWRVQLFAYLRDRHGEWVEIEAPPTTEGLLLALEARGIGGGYCRLAVNRAFASDGQSLNTGDELALIPPVSGG
ncbi:MAG: MoaD/ThiS family protein [Fimbriimonas ginsengisoli]|uniref:MoaD/ThiS family protein n=1 Tax=Fimbriimonas ginsengisoli TaxID=1005039 RepID=A0A931LW91_FIMGI|nr:MoaD/ThiS family protein [Fimbriimonas ginsengisoli]